MKIKMKSRLKLSKMKLKKIKTKTYALQEEASCTFTGFMRKQRNEWLSCCSHQHHHQHPHPPQYWQHRLRYYKNNFERYWRLLAIMIFLNVIIINECTTSLSSTTNVNANTNAPINEREHLDPFVNETYADIQLLEEEQHFLLRNKTNYTQTPKTTTTSKWQQYEYNNSTSRPFVEFNHSDSIFLHFVKQFPSGNELWDGIIRDCYHKTSFSCLQKNVYTYLSDVLEMQDLNVTQRLKFYQNRNVYAENKDKSYWKTTEASAAKSFQDFNEISNDIDSGAIDGSGNIKGNEEYKYPSKKPYFKDHELPPETPIEEVTNALYTKSVKFVLTHDVEMKLPEIMFDGATFRISPRSIEGNGLIAKLELIPKQEIEARLAGKILFKKMQQFLRSKVLLAVLALILIIKIIKVKLFWLLPLIIGVSAAKKLLLKFLLFLFPALSHLFKLCSYYQQTYHHTTKYHHHHHLIDHHHTIIPPTWPNAEHNPIPEIVITHPPKGHISTYLHGAPIHGVHKHPLYEPYESGWENSGPGLGSEYINDINRIAQIDENSGHFQPHIKNDANELHDWGLGTTQAYIKQQQEQQQQKNTLTQKRRQSVSAVLHKPPLQSSSSTSTSTSTSIQSLAQNYKKPQVTSQTFNPFKQTDIQFNKSSLYNNNNNVNHKYKNVIKGAQTIVSPVYVPPGRLKPQPQHKTYLKPNGTPSPFITVSAQMAAPHYDPTLTQLNITPEMQAQLKEALRIQNEQRIVQQQQKILEKQPFAMDGQPLMPLNYDPFYTPILIKIDQIIEPLGIMDDFCKERLVCSMYKNPNRYSPHSNFISVELSRDVNELPTVEKTNAAMMRFFRLIQAARDGQDQKNCLISYPNCSIHTE